MRRKETEIPFCRSFEQMAGASEGKGHHRKGHHRKSLREENIPWEGLGERGITALEKPRRKEERVHPENRVIGFVLLPISPAELGKTTNTTFTTSNNAFDKPCAEPSSLGLCHGEKGYHEMEPTRFARIAILLQGKQQNTRLRQDITPGEISRKCVQGEALFIVVSLAATLGQHGPRRGDVPAKRCYLLAQGR